MKGKKTGQWAKDKEQKCQKVKTTKGKTTSGTVMYSSASTLDSYLLDATSAQIVPSKPDTTSAIQHRNPFYSTITGCNIPPT